MEPDRPPRARTVPAGATRSNASHAASSRTGLRHAPRWAVWTGGVVLALVVALIVCEVLGWPFLARPVQERLSQALDRRVSFAATPGAEPEARFNFLGGLRFRAPHVQLAAPVWSQAPYMLAVDAADLRLRYVDLWRVYRGGPIRIEALEAARIDGTIERLADGRASWQLGKAKQPADPNAPAPTPAFGRLQVGSGTIAYRDAKSQLALDSRFSLTDGSAPSWQAANVAAASSVAAASAPAVGAASEPSGLVASTSGTYRGNLKVQANVRTTGVLPYLGPDAARTPLPVRLDLAVGNARAEFEGTTTDAVNLGGLSGRFKASGPSFASVGDPLGITLPATPPFETHGRIVKRGTVWNAVFEDARVGQSQLNGAFQFDASRAKPLLAGRIQGPRLLLSDLGPAIGAPPSPAATQRAARAAQAKAEADEARRASGKVLPDKPFDLPALRAMDANVLIDIDHLDLGTDLLQPLRPMRTHLVLTDGVLRLTDIDARTGQGSLAGSLQLDGRQPVALWNADLALRNVQLDQWIRQKRSGDAPPYISGRMSGQAQLSGEGKSTADILASLKGGVRVHLLDGSISHLAVEAAGIDVAQALGMLFKGDDALPINCTVADLTADRGTLKPRVMVVDTADSTLWVDGSVSLASEAMDLRVVVTPKDFSPLALRSPIHVKGTFGNPDIGIEKTPIALRAGGAALLALVNPLAAVIPLLDFGSGDDAKRGADRCRALSQRQLNGAAVPGGRPEAAASPAAGTQQRIASRRP